MANTDIPINVTAEELEEAVQKVPQHETAIANNAADIRKIEMIPRNIECKIDWNYQDSVTAVVVECDIGESHETFNTIVSMTTGKPDLFGDLSGAKSIDLCLKLFEDSQSGETSWGLSEGYNDGNPFVKYEIRVGTYWYIADTSPVVITGFCSFDNKNLFENYNADMSNKADIGYTNNTFSNAIKGAGTGTALLFDDVSPIAHKVELSGTAGGSVSVYGLNIMPKNYVDGGFNMIGSEWKSGSMPGYQHFSVVYGQKLRLIIDGTAVQCRYMIKDKDKNIIKSLDNTKVADGHVININVEGAAYLTFRFLSGTHTEDGVTHEFMLIEGAGEIPDFEPYKGTQTITLDENGKGEADSVSPNMTVVSDSEVEVEYNRDASKIINQLLIDNENLKNAVTALGGTL